MKILYFISIIIIISCSPKALIPFERTGQVEFYQGDKNTLTVISNGFAENENKAVYFAERNALENILYRGIPNSNQENPMIPNENESDRYSKSTLDALILDQGYRRYMIESNTNLKDKQKNGVFIKRMVKFDIQSLRKYLEDNKVVRKFGF